MRGFISDIWMTVSKTGVPRSHGSRKDALKRARKDKVSVYRQDRGDGRVDLVYDAKLDVEYKPWEFTVEEIPPEKA